MMSLHDSPLPQLLDKIYLKMHLTYTVFILQFLRTSIRAYLSKVWKNVLLDMEYYQFFTCLKMTMNGKG